MLAVIVASIITFVSTEIDDLLLLFVLFSRTKTKQEKAGVIIGKFVALALVSCCCGFFAVYISRIDSKYIGLLGIVPIVIGIKVAVKKRDDEVQELESKETDDNKSKSIFALILETIIISLASSGDNVAVYIPFFSSLRGWDFFVAGIVFALMQTVWCVISLRVVNTSVVQNIIDRWYRIIIPVLFILLGGYILIKCGTASWVLSLL